MHTRLLLVCAGATEATKIAAFPQDEPLQTRSLTHAAELARHGDFSGPMLTSPRLNARQTAEILNPGAVEDYGLTEWDCGRWAGRRLADIEEKEPDALDRWLSDPAAAPHGGESLIDLYERVSGWLASHNGAERRLIAVTHPAFIRCAVATTLGAPHHSFWRLDIASLSIVDMRGDGNRWRIRSFGPRAFQSEE